MKVIKVILADDQQTVKEALNLFISSDQRLKVIAECDNGDNRRSGYAGSSIPHC